jgi:hypothetical protein
MSIIVVSFFVYYSYDLLVGLLIVVHGVHPYFFCSTPSQDLFVAFLVVVHCLSSSLVALFFPVVITLLVFWL